MKKNIYLPSEKQTLIIRSIKDSYKLIYKDLVSLDFISELISIKEKNFGNEKLESLLVFFGASYFKKYVEGEKISKDQKIMRTIISVLFYVLNADLSDRILWVIYSKKEFLEIKKEVLKFDFQGKEIIESYF